MAGKKPGWYAQGTGQRYWDGEAWHDAVPVHPGPGPTERKGSPGKVILAVVVGLLFVVIAMSIGGGGDKDERPKSAGSSSTKPTISAERYQREVIYACQNSVSKGLRDPDSAKFDQWKAWEVTAAGSEPPAPLPFNRAAGDKYFSAGGLVNARNGFGGYTGDQAYSCSATATPSGDVKAIAQLLELPSP